MVVYVLRHIEQAFVDTKKELRLLSVTDYAPGKGDPAVFVLIKFAAENRADVGLKPAAIEQHLKTGRNNVMLNRNSVRLMFRAQQTVAKFLEHLRQSFVKIQFRAQFLQLAYSSGDPC